MGDIFQHTLTFTDGDALTLQMVLFTKRARAFQTIQEIATELKNKKFDSVTNLYSLIWSQNSISDTYSTGEAVASGVVRAFPKYSATRFVTMYQTSRANNGRIRCYLGSTSTNGVMVQDMYHNNSYSAWLSTSFIIPPGVDACVYPTSGNIKMFITRLGTAQIKGVYSDGTNILSPNCTITNFLSDIVNQIY